jgi:hypothetical protein
MTAPINPSPNGTNGRNTRGQFTKGNPGGPGNPIHSRMAYFRATLLSTVTQEDVRAVALKLTACAKAGEPWAVKEFLDRVMGRAPQTVELIGSEGGPLRLTLPELQAAVLDSLQGHPEARLAVAARLRAMADEHDRPADTGRGA